MTLTSALETLRLTSVVKHSSTGAENTTISSTIPHNPKRKINGVKMSVRNAPCTDHYSKSIARADTDV